jgi:L-rhamnose mutarotase
VTRVADRFRLREGMRDEYIRRHEALWPEMAAAMRAAGIRNYSIWLSGTDLFGYYEVDDAVTCNRLLAASPVVAQWNRMMGDIVAFDQPRMERVFLFEGEVNPC